MVFDGSETVTHLLASPPTPVTLSAPAGPPGRAARPSPPARRCSTARRASGSTSIARLPTVRQTSYPKANTDYTGAVLLSIHTWWVHTHARAGR
eukprot:scaffold29089_cov60-Phaeocystis_antarctica.AAC.4